MIEMKKNLKYYGNIFIFTAVLMLILNAVVPVTLAAGPANPAQSAGDNQRVPILITFKAAATAADIDDSIRTSGGDKGRMFGPIRTLEIFVSSNAKDSIIAAFSRQASVERVAAAVKRKIAGIPNDPSYEQQWALPRIAWDQAYGTISIRGLSTIAVMDTGIDGSHPDLTARMIEATALLAATRTQTPMVTAQPLQASRLQA
jgi:subtilisin family serine protease